MVRVVGKEGALGAGAGGKCTSGMDGSKFFYITLYTCLQMFIHVHTCLHIASNSKFEIRFVSTGSGISSGGMYVQQV